MFKQDLELIDALRRDAVNVREAHPSGVKKLQAYAVQLIWIGGKFPLDVSCAPLSLLLSLFLLLSFFLVFFFFPLPSLV